MKKLHLVSIMVSALSCFLSCANSVTGSSSTGSMSNVVVESVDSIINNSPKFDELKDVSNGGGVNDPFKSKIFYSEGRLKYEFSENGELLVSQKKYRGTEYDTPSHVYKYKYSDNSLYLQLYKRRYYMSGIFEMDKAEPLDVLIPLYSTALDNLIKSQDTTGYTQEELDYQKSLLLADAKIEFNSYKEYTFKVDGTTNNVTLTSKCPKLISFKDIFVKNFDGGFVLNPLSYSSDNRISCCSGELTLTSEPTLRTYANFSLSCYNNITPTTVTTDIYNEIRKEHSHTKVDSKSDITLTYKISGEANNQIIKFTHGTNNVELKYTPEVKVLKTTENLQ